MHITNISQAKANLSHLIKVLQENSEPIIIGNAGKPVAILSAYNENNIPRKLGGSWEGSVIISDDFDGENEVISESFYNSSIFPSKS